MSNLIKTDKAYKNWISDVSKRFRQSQLKAAIKVNEDMLRFYWSMGRDIFRMNNDAKYGSRFYNAISADLKEIFPDIKSFSPTNLKYMRYFYEMYPTAENRQQAADDLAISDNRQQPVDDSEMQLIFRIPWGHQMFLLDKCKGEQQKALFYVKKQLKITGQELCFRISSVLIFMKEKAKR